MKKKELNLTLILHQTQKSTQRLTDLVRAETVESPRGKHRRKHRSKASWRWPWQYLHRSNTNSMVTKPKTNKYDHTN